MLRLLPAALSLFAAAGCASTDRQTISVGYGCDYGKAFAAKYDPTSRQMIIDAGGVVRGLPQRLSASGSHFGDDTGDFRSRGRTATLEGFPGGPYLNCTVR